jgi:hypothetical protein
MTEMQSWSNVVYTLGYSTLQDNDGFDFESNNRVFLMQLKEDNIRLANHCFSTTFSY